MLYDICAIPQLYAHLQKLVIDRNQKFQKNLQTN